MELLDKLKWRYAAKAMNGEKVSDEKLERILEAARLAPTSSGLQPFEIFVVSNQDVKNQLNPNSAIEKKEYFSILISNCVAVEKNKR